MKLLRFLLLPLSILYGWVLEVRNLLFDKHLLVSKSYEKPLIGIGNLATGGTGKSVLVDFILSHFKQKYQLATLSRGYGRKTKGYLLGTDTTTASSLGDEPFQFLQKHPEVKVAVCEKRLLGVDRLLREFPNLEGILLDDVFQHRWVQPTLQIVTTSYQNPFSRDYLLPTGNLREKIKGARRAAIILVTKIPESSTEEERITLAKELRRKPDQAIYFCKINYASLLKGANDSPFSALSTQPFILVTGIANATPMVEYLHANKLVFDHLEYSDHHNFTTSDLQTITSKAASKWVVTTEKDYGRLQPLLPPTISIYYLPIEMKFISKTDEKLFLTSVEKVLLKV